MKERTTSRSSTSFAIVIAFVASTATACSTSADSNANDGAPPCVAGLTPSCAAEYAPATYATIYAKIFQPNCATGTGTCHTSDAAKGGLVFADENQSYAMLLGKNGNPARVTPNDPSCSLLMKRLESTDPKYHMPQGPNSLLPGELCTIVQWIAGGAAQ